MKDKTFEESAEKCTDSDFWINQGKESDKENMYCDILIDIRNSILLLAKVIQERPLK